MTTRSQETKLQDGKVSNLRAAQIEADMQIALDLPYDIQMFNSPYDNIFYHNIALNSSHNYLGMKIG